MLVLVTLRASCVAAAIVLRGLQGGEYSTHRPVPAAPARADAASQAIDSLQRDVDSLKTLKRLIETDPATQERIAREDFGMVRDKELLFRFLRPGFTQALGADRSGLNPAGVGPVHFCSLIAGWSSLVARRAHNPKVAGSNPAPATTNERGRCGNAPASFFFPWFDSDQLALLTRNVTCVGVTIGMYPAPASRHEVRARVSDRRRAP